MRNRHGAKRSRSEMPYAHTNEPVADGYYEWEKREKKKFPFFFRLKSGNPFAFAGLWETWSPPDMEPLESCTIITGEPNALVAKIHDRQPIMLHESAFDSWLSPEALTAEAALEPLVPYPADEMEFWEVSPVVNSARYAGADCILRVS